MNIHLELWPNTSTAIAFFALLVSAITMWATLFRAGHLKMTRPNQFFLGPDGLKFDKGDTLFMRSLLYSTGRRGLVIENMSVEVVYDEKIYSYVIWVFGNEKLSRGAGLYVGDQGVVANHHFLRNVGSESIKYESGDYKIKIWADVIGYKQRLLVHECTLHITIEQAMALGQSGTGIFFDWGPSSRKYISHVDRRPPSELNDEMKAFLALASKDGQGAISKSID